MMTIRKFICILFVLEIFSKKNTTTASEVVYPIFQLKELTVSIDSDIVDLQQSSFYNKLGFEGAFEKAMHTILSEVDDLESPMSMMIEDRFNELNQKFIHPIPTAIKLHAQINLKKLLNRSSTVVSLYHERTKEQYCPPPERKEDVKDFWIFCLKIPDYSDHMYWILVDRLGAKTPYIYGFN